MTLLELKQITPETLSAVLELDQLCFDGLWTLEGYERELNSPNSDLLGLSIPLAPNPYEVDGQNSLSANTRHYMGVPSVPASLLGMGCQWAILEEAHITILAVHPDYQRQGLGQALLISLLTAAYDRGLERATLEVRASNKPALSLYKKFGFKPAGRRQRYYKDTGEDALILWRGELQHPKFQQTLAIWHSSVCDRLALAGWDLQMTLSPLLPDLYP